LIAGSVKALLPKRVRGRLRSLRRSLRRGVELGDLDRLTPVSREYGYDRGEPVDRYYIERFLERHSEDVRGRVLEIGEDAYTRRFGGSRVVQSDVLHEKEGNPVATIVADLTDAPHIPSAAYDCVILTETLQLVYELRAALTTICRILKPGGVVLATVPGISQFDGAGWEWCWCFTAYSARRLFEEFFPPSQVSVEAHGNVYLAVAFLHGLCTEELRSEAFEYRDRDYQLVITIRAAMPNPADAEP
jgi:SAM-dependent methyltransferase